MENNKIVGQNIYLRPIELTDTEDIIRWRNKDWIRRKFIHQNLFTVKKHEKWFETIVKTGKAVQFIIYEIKSDSKIGSTYLRDINCQHRKAEYGIFIGEEDALGKGYGTEAADLVLKYGFEQLKLHKIFLRVLADNKRAITSYKKAGFEEEAYLKSDVFLEGGYRDIILMGKVM